MESNEFDGAFKKKAPPRASRRRQAAEDEDPDSSVPVGAAANNGAKKSGWGEGAEDSSSTAAPGPGRRRRAADEEEDEGAVSTAPTSQIANLEEDDEGPSMFIPDLEDEEENIGMQVAVAPSHKSSRVPTIAELDKEIDMALPSTSEAGVDLSVLQSFLTPQEQVQEEDEPWNVEHELQMLASDLQREQDERDGTSAGGASLNRKTKASGSSSSSAVAVS